MQEIDVVGNIAVSHLRFMLNTTLWESFDSDVLNIILPPQSWSEVKLLDFNGKGTHNLVQSQMTRAVYTCFWPSQTSCLAHTCT